MARNVNDIAREVAEDRKDRLERLQQMGAPEAAMQPERRHRYIALKLAESKTPLGIRAADLNERCLNLTRPR